MIITNNEEALRIKCEDVLPEEVGELVELLERELQQSARLGRPGIGLAAPQIGIAKKIAIVRLGSNGHYDLNFNLVNCQIQKGFDQKMFTDEGCLSFPGRLENTMRYQEIYVTDNLVHPTSFVATGLPAIVVQHELDHINGILLPDRALPKRIELSNFPDLKKVGVNDKCPCGSGKKFKKCCRKAS